MEKSSYKKIDKEIIPTLSFSRNIDIDQSDDLRSLLEKATVLGNAYHSKVTIYFQDDSGPKRVETTIWATGTKYICLKGGMWIPISRIEDIEI